MSDFIHNRNGYDYHRCRCVACVEAHNTACREMQRQIRARAREERQAVEARGGRYVAPAHLHHGTHTTYVNYGCRCDPCREAKSSYAREWRARRRKNSPESPQVTPGSPSPAGRAAADGEVPGGSQVPEPLGTEHP